jgi:tetratricopeptide (TPR) repeat protein
MIWCSVRQTMNRPYAQQHRPWRAWALASAIAFSAGGFVSVAHGGDDNISQEDRTRARAAFQAGLALEAAGDWGKALQKFQEMATIKVTPQALFHQGRCLEHLGRWTEAVGMYRMAVDKADEPKLEDVRKEADAARAALEARLPKLIIRLGKGAAGAAVTLDGVAIGSAFLGTPMAVDPGLHKLEATVPGRQDKVHREVSVTEAQVQDVTIEVEAVAPPPAPSSTSSQGNSTDNAWLGIPTRTGYIIAGAGLASMVAGGVFYYLRQGTIDDLDEACQAKHCFSSDESKANRGKLYTALGNGLFLGGLVVGAFGTVVILKNKQPSAPAAAAVAPPQQINLSFGSGPDAFGAHLTGVF